jgi:ABC-type spermidine/putrescine transport system permease subunit II
MRRPGKTVVISAQTLLLLILYLFLYFPIFYIVYLSFMENSIWPFPPVYTFEWYTSLSGLSDFQKGLWNSMLFGISTLMFNRGVLRLGYRG